MKAPIIKLDYSERKDFHLAFFSDLHIDAEDCRREELTRDLAEAANMGARIVINGDWGDFILPSDRKRYTHGTSICHSDRPIDEAVEMAFNLLAPYANIIDLIGSGNHEESVVKFHHTDPTTALITKLNTVRDSSLAPIVHGGYASFMLYRFHHGDSGSVKTLKIYRHHGLGGGGRSKGILKLEDMMASVDADVYTMGHNHQGVADPDQRVLAVDQNGKVIEKQKIAFYTPGYKGQLAPDEQYPKLRYSDRFLTNQASGYRILHIDARNSGLRKTLIIPGRRG